MNLMNTINEEEFDYQTYTKEHPPDPSKIHRGTHFRKQRFEKKMKGMVHIDEDILEQFQNITPKKQEYEKLINHALREWLSANKSFNNNLRKDEYVTITE